ncbi:MAG TPA: sporulation protein YtfJ [Desulfotomaculum sp.]|nr:MAG: sporulation protein [Peptococcaceae bacterium BRH_c8a]KJS74652.1 MAG: sporulation protein [Desulfotomaculum sp. BICA1-6]HBX24337.1 sporulation protein YtfJ [Desulfotomaculum sp.]
MDEQQHPIEGLMRTAMEAIQEMVSVNSVVGEPVETPDGSVIIPVSRVSCGFGAGGSEFEIAGKSKGGNEDEQMSPAFGGGSGAGMSVKPVGFLVAGNGHVRMLPVDGNALLDRLMDMTPQLLSQIQGMFEKAKKDKKPELD